MFSAPKCRSVEYSRNSRASAQDLLSGKNDLLTHTHKPVIPIARTDQSIGPEGAESGSLE